MSFPTPLTNEIMNANQQATDGWAKFLDADTLKNNLVGSAMYIVSFEIMRNSILDHLRGYYTRGYSDGKRVFSERYKSEVLALHKSPLTASLLWFKKNGVVDDDDIDAVDRIREHRNLLAHELPKIITDCDYEIDFSLYTNIQEIVAKIDRWWVREVEIPTNPDMDHLDADSIPDLEITSGNMVFLHLLQQIVADDGTNKWYNDIMNGTAEHAVHPSQPNAE